MRKQLRFWAGIVAINVVGSVLAGFLFGGATLHTPWRRLVEAGSVTFVFSFSCSALCLIVMPPLVSRIWRRVSFPLNWTLIVTALVLFATAGNLGAVLILTGVGFFDASDFSEVFISSLRVSIIVTLLIGSFYIATEILRARLNAATLALATKARDEADARRLAAEAQLASLESRVHPHFLFNTLNSIASLIPSDPAGAERMTGQLASLMRSSLNADPLTLARLGDELEVVRAYLDIERVRFGDRLRYTIGVPADLLDFEVPRLSLQTLVENSVKYAVASKREGACLAVTAVASPDGVRLTVEDDGPGFDPAVVPAGHGLALLRARLAMAFGERAMLRIDGRPGRTMVSVEIGRG